MATVAFQTIPPYLYALGRSGTMARQEGNDPSYYLGKCLGWALDGPVVKRLHPEFSKGQPVTPMPRTSPKS